MAPFLTRSNLEKSTNVNGDSGNLTSLGAEEGNG
jgi:hypothetical protein